MWFCSSSPLQRFSAFRGVEEGGKGGEEESAEERRQRELILDRQTLEQIINDYTVAQESRALGLVVSDQELASELRGYPAFQRNGRYEPELFEQFWVSAGFNSPRAFT